MPGGVPDRTVEHPNQDYTPNAIQQLLKHVSFRYGTNNNTLPHKVLYKTHYHHTCDH